ncbi:MAG: purine-nucleoside phosphorylase [Alphaproteobacteria bacterium]
MSDDLLDAARAVRERAYAPYSRFAVGAALLADDGRIYTGANVENAAFPEGQCAEASAIGAMIAGGGRRIEAVCVVAGGERLIAPCGGCRQRLAEFADPAVPVQLADLDAVRQTVTVGDLLPHGFGGAHLAHGEASPAPAVDRLAALPGAREARIAVVLGSGLGAFVERLSDRAEVTYTELAGFPRPSVAGHAGVVTAGRLGGVPILVLQGRAHLYEGAPAAAITAPVRALKALGVRLLVLTNAAGAIGPDLAVGELALIADHINGLGTNPLVGPNDAAAGPRFVDMSAVYDPDLRARVAAVAARLGIRLPAAVYLATLGPCFETPAEIRAFRALGADLVGMSTVPEAIAARHAGLTVLGLSAVTNRAAGLAAGPLSHEQTLAGAARAGETLAELLTHALPELHDVV